MKQPPTLPDFAALQPVHIHNNTNHNTSFAVDVQQLLDESDAPFAFLVEGLVQKTGLACLAGSSDTGKSCLLRQLAVAVAGGAQKFLGWKLNTVHRSAIYVTTEDGREATRHLLRQQRKRAKGQPMNLRFVFDDTDLLANLDKELAVRPADLVVIDCFADVFGGNLRAAHRVRKFLHSFQLLAERHQCLVLFLHHTTTDAEYLEPGKDNLQSTDGLEAKMRLVLELRTDPVNRQRRHLCVVKGNYLPADTKGESYVLHFDERTFTYTNTNERYPFALLMKPERKDKRNEDIAKDKYRQAFALQRTGLSYRQIAEKMGYSAKSTVAAIFQRARAERWDSYLFDRPADEKDVVVVDEYSDDIKCPANCKCGDTCEDKAPIGYRYRTVN